MQNTILYTSLGLSIVAFVLVIVLFILDITRHKDGAVDKLPPMRLRGVDLIAPENVSIKEPPAMVDGLMLEEGHRVWLERQLNPMENGLYEIQQNGQWSRLDKGDGVVVTDEEVAAESRRITQEDVLKGLVITKRDVVLPDPYELKGAQLGQVFPFKVLNYGDEDVELGFSSHWLDRCDDDQVSSRGGAEFVLRTTERGGEIYRVS